MLPGWAALLAGLSVMLLVAPSVGPGRPLPWRPVAAGCVVAAPVWLLHGHQLVLAGVLLMAAATLRRLVQAQRAAGDRDRAALGVRGFCEALAAELVAGAPPQRALAEAVREMPELGPVASAAQLDADVPASLRLLALRPGCHDLRLVAAAWQVAMRTGGGLAAPLECAAAAVRARRRTAQVVAAELAPTRATAQLMAALPVVFLLAGSGLGGHPLVFLLATTSGIACLAAGLALTCVGLAWLQRIADAVEQDP